MLAQMEGSGRGALGAYNAQGYTDLSSFLAESPMRDGDAWLEALLKRNEMLGEPIFCWQVVARWHMRGLPDARP